jgi:hypothetical protein
MLIPNDNSTNLCQSQASQFTSSYASVGANRSTNIWWMGQGNNNAAAQNVPSWTMEIVIQNQTNNWKTYRGFGAGYGNVISDNSSAALASGGLYASYEPITSMVFKISAGTFSNFVYSVYGSTEE